MAGTLRASAFTPQVRTAKLRWLLAGVLVAAVAATGVGIYLATGGKPGSKVSAGERSAILEQAKADGVIRGYHAASFGRGRSAWRYVTNDGMVEIGLRRDCASQGVDGARVQSARDRASGVAVEAVQFERRAPEEARYIGTVFYLAKDAEAGGDVQDTATAQDVTNQNGPSQSPSCRHGTTLLIHIRDSAIKEGLTILKIAREYYPHKRIVYALVSRLSSPLIGQ